jgi:hypothetical protein
MVVLHKSQVDPGAEKGGAAIRLGEEAAIVAEPLRLDELIRRDGGARDREVAAHAIASAAAPTLSLWPR